MPIDPLTQVLLATRIPLRPHVPEILNPETESVFDNPVERLIKRLSGLVGGQTFDVTDIAPTPLTFAGRMSRITKKLLGPNAGKLVDKLGTKVAKNIDTPITRRDFLNQITGKTGRDQRRALDVLDEYAEDYARKPHSMRNSALDRSVAVQDELDLSPEEAFSPFVTEAERVMEAAKRSGAFPSNQFDTALGQARAAHELFDEGASVMMGEVGSPKFEKTLDLLTSQDPMPLSNDPITRWLTRHVPGVSGMSEELITAGQDAEDTTHKLLQELFKRYITKRTP
jgi:hypothetical protein